MTKPKSILIVLAAVIAVAVVCSMSASGMLDSASHTADSAALFRAMDVMQSQNSTIDKLVNVLTIQNAALVIVALVVLFFAFQLVRSFRNVDSHPAFQSLGPAGGMRFLSMDLPRARAAIRKLDYQHKQQLLNQLYVICSILESDLGYGVKPDKQLAVKNQNDSTVTWG